MTEPHRFGFVTLAGPANVGKSTLLNAIIGEKISIVSPRPQTTRHRILAIHTTATCQIAFVDTPGLHTDHKKSLNRIINRTAITSFNDVDAVLFMLDTKGWSDERLSLLGRVKEAGVPIILLLNKIDRLPNKEQLLPLIAACADVHPFAAIIPICALKLDNRARLIAAIAELLPVGDRGFPADQISTGGDRFFASELIREQVYLRLGQELPYAIAVDINRFERKDNGMIIEALLYVEKPSQKPIVIGRDGQQLKKIGSAARRHIEQAFKCKIHLSLWVKVRKNWSDNETLIQTLGYGGEDR